jgi:surface antigen
MTQLRIVKPLLLILASTVITGCIYSNNSEPTAPSAQSQAALAEQGSTTPPETIKAASSGPLGGYLEQFMDANDKSKMARALDGGLGKSIHWKNPVSGFDFAVTPIAKASGNGICRSYSVSMIKTGITDRVNGTACIGDDGAWHVAG